MLYQCPKCRAEFMEKEKENYYEDMVCLSCGFMDKPHTFEKDELEIENVKFLCKSCNKKSDSIIIKKHNGNKTGWYVCKECNKTKRISGFEKYYNKEKLDKNMIIATSKFKYDSNDPFSLRSEEIKNWEQGTNLKLNLEGLSKKESIDKGWQCPVCGMVYSPNITSCNCSCHQTTEPHIFKSNYDHNPVNTCNTCNESEG